MESRRKTLEKLARADGDGMARTAGGPFPPPKGGSNEASPFPPKGGGDSGFPPGGSTGMKRDIPKGHEFNAKALKPMAKMLLAMSVSLGHALTAYREFTRLKSSTISPDGRLGGRGYVMDVRDVRKKLYEACESLSAISDTVHDEIKAPHWQPQLAALVKGEAEDIQRFVEEAEAKLDEDEEKEEEIPEFEAADKEEKPAKGRKTWNKDDSNSKGDGEFKSQVPDGGDNEVVQEGPKDRPKIASQQASTDPWKAHVVVAAQQSAIDPWKVNATSSLPVETLPGGPRVEHLDRGDQPGPWGSWNRDEVPSQDNYDNRQRQNDYANKLSISPSEPVGESAMPGALTDTTRTDAYDFGIGSNNSPANGGGLQHTPEPPSGKGVWGPSSQLPDSPGQVQAPDAQHGEAAEQGLAEGANTVVAARPIRGMTRLVAFLDDVSFGYLPNDNSPPVARSDYYDGPKDNIVSESKMPGTQIPAKPTPSTWHPKTPETMISQSEMPGDNTVVPQTRDLGTPGGGQVVEPDVDTAFVRFDDTTTQHRQDLTNQYQYSRPKNATNTRKTDA